MTIPSQNVLSVQAIPTLSNEVNDIRLRSAQIVSDYVIPKENILSGLKGKEAQYKEYGELQNHVKEQGLWKPHLLSEYGGMGAVF
jgi:hypothetical protein